MSPWFAAPFVLQGAAMVFDEFHFHRKRGMGKWERLGHPLDTLTVLAPFILILTVPPSAVAMIAYLALCGFSCLFITKDEFIHASECEPMEHWLHSVLFVLHPLVFLTAYLIWPDLAALGWRAWIPVASILSLLLHQILYWNTPWKPLT